MPGFDISRPPVSEKEQANPASKPVQSDPQAERYANNRKTASEVFGLPTDYNTQGLGAYDERRGRPSRGFNWKPEPLFHPPPNTDKYASENFDVPPDTAPDDYVNGYSKPRRESPIPAMSASVKTTLESGDLNEPSKKNGELPSNTESPPEAPKTKIVERPLPVTLEELFKGTTKKIKFKARDYVTATGKMVDKDKILEMYIKPGLRKGSKVKFNNVPVDGIDELQALHFI